MQNHKVHDLIIPIKSDVYARIMNELYQIYKMRKLMNPGEV